MPLDASEIRSRVKRIKSLPTLAGVVKNLFAKLSSESTSFAEVSEIINRDQVLASKVLKIINSPVYGFSGRIATINHALVLLGFTVVKGIVLSAAVMDQMRKCLTGLWEHSLGVEMAADKIARTLGVREREEISTAGLLHDLGKVIIGVEMHQESELVLNEVRDSKVPFIEAERRVLNGVTHPKIGLWLAEEWKFSARLLEPIAFHHSPRNADSAKEATAIIHLADILIRALQFGSGGDPYIPQIDRFALEVLDLRMGDLAGLMDVIEDELEGLDTSDFA
jgi:putative nucleotidyltransferase with HDIG domain